MVNLWTKGADKAAVASSLSQSNRLCRPLRHVAPSADSLLDRLLEDGTLLAVTAAGVVVLIAVGVCVWLRCRSRRKGKVA